MFHVIGRSDRKSAAEGAFEAIGSRFFCFFKIRGLNPKTRRVAGDTG